MFCSAIFLTFCSAGNSATKIADLDDHSQPKLMVSHHSPPEEYIMPTALSTVKSFNYTIFRNCSWNKLTHLTWPVRWANPNACFKGAISSGSDSHGFLSKLWASIPCPKTYCRVTRVYRNINMHTKLEHYRGAQISHSAISHNFRIVVISEAAHLATSGTDLLKHFEVHKVVEIIYSIANCSDPRIDVIYKFFERWTLHKLSDN